MYKTVSQRIVQAASLHLSEKNMKLQIYKMHYYITSVLRDSKIAAADFVARLQVNLFW